MNANLRRVWVTQGVVAACGVGLLVGFVGQPMAYDSWWNSDLLIWRALLVSALVLGATFGLGGGLAARAGHLGWAQAAVVAFAPLALAIPALLCGRWNVYDTTPLRSGAMVTSTLGWLIAIAVQAAFSTALGRRGHFVRHDRDSFEVSRSSPWLRLWRLHGNRVPKRVVGHGLPAPGVDLSRRGAQ
ncbi:MAG TPA: hypothetical protein VIM01_06605 [Dermatophilaceae bacterium]|jgi:hypothetical protein